MPLPIAPTDRTRISRQEWLCLAGAILLGAILRLSFPGRMAIEHFDEGVYASNFWFGAESGYEYPARRLYAPPLLPAVIEWTMIVASLGGFRPTGFVPLIPCLIAGLVTIPSIWWVGRRWFGPTAGIVSAWLVAASDFHSSYTRAALTDVPVCLFMLWGVFFLWQAMQTGSRRDTLLAGLLTGLAWWTKYNGWLPLAIGLSAGIAWQLSLPSLDRQLMTVGKRWLLVAGLSFLLWSPVLIGLQKQGGYRAVAANHRQYVGGLKEWRHAAIRQMTHVGIYENGIGAVYEACFRTQVERSDSELSPAELRFDGKSSGPGVAGSSIGDGINPRGLVVAPPILMLVVSLVASIAWIILRRTRSPLAAWMLLAWICGLSLATPFYHPYPRLVLPWLVAIWLGAGLAVELLVGSRRLLATTSITAGLDWKMPWIEVAIAGWLLLGTVIRCLIGTEKAWQDRSELSRAIDEELAPMIKEKSVSAGFPEDEAIVYVYGEPAVFCALKGAGLSLVGPVQDLGFLSRPQSRPTFLIRSDRALRSPEFQAEWDAHRNDFEVLKMRAVHESPLVHFDQPDDFSQIGDTARPGESLWLFRAR